MEKHPFEQTHRLRMKRRDFSRFFLFSVGYGLASCTRPLSPPSKSEKIGDENALKIWWEEGFYPEETNAIKEIIFRWESRNDIKVELTTIPLTEILKKLKDAIDEKNAPDIFYAGIGGDATIIPQLAWNNELVALNDVLAPLKDLYDPIALSAVNYQNKVAGKRNYYALPIMQSAIHIHYWQDMLTEIGISRKNIPRDWKGFWRFWEQAQDRLRSARLPAIYSIGLPCSPCLDTYNIFEQFLEAYDVRLLDSEGNLRIDEPEVRQGISKTLTQYTQFHKNDKVPPKAVDWDNTGNNKTLLNRKSLMTINNTLSIPASQRQAENIYYNRMSTVPWPNKPSGSPMRYITEVKQVILLKSSNKQKIAKDFLSYLAQPEKLQRYIEGAQIRYLPVMPSLLKESFWQDPRDVHSAVALQQLQNARPAYQIFNPAYSEVAAQNVWGNTIRKICMENLSIEEATDQVITKIKEIFADWK